MELALNVWAISSHKPAQESGISRERLKEINSNSRMLKGVIFEMKKFLQADKVPSIKLKLFGKSVMMVKGGWVRGYVVPALPTGRLTADMWFAIVHLSPRRSHISAERC